jgi:hypothetical protein
MNAYIAAIPGHWYRDASSGEVFQVVGLDEDDRTINIQHVDGSLDETAFDDWMTRHVENCDQPEDWVGPYDDLQSDEIGLPEATESRSETPINRALLDLEERTPRLDDI